MTLCVVNDDCVEFEVIPSGPNASKYHWKARMATPQSALGASGDVPSASNLNALRCVADPSDATKKVMFVPEHTARTDIDIGGGSYTPDYQRGVSFTVAPADLNAYNLHTIHDTIVNPSSGRTFAGLMSMRGGANINIAADTAAQVLLETGFGTIPGDLTATGAVTIAGNIADRWSLWINGGGNATQSDTASITDNPTFNLPPSGSFTYWARVACRMLNLGAKGGYTINEIRGLLKWLGTTK